MKCKQLTYHFILNGILITFIGLAGGLFLIKRSYAGSMELTNAYLNANLVSLYLQPLMLTIFYRQVLTFRKVYIFIGIRKKIEQMTAYLIAMATIYCVLFLLGLLLPYLFTNYPFFKNGNPLLGISLLLLHAGVLIFLAWILVAGYKMKYPYLLLFIVIILELLYHFYFEKNILVLYSPLYDPLYRATHYIYGGY